MCKSILSDKLPYTLHTIRETFSRGSGLDICATIARDQGYTSLFFCDTDMLFTKRDIFDNAKTILGNNQIFYPICFSFTQANHEQGYWRDVGYGMVFMNTETYFNSSRWKHNVSWGYEDNDLYNNLPKEKIVRSKCLGYFHQWHPNSIEFKTAEYPIKKYLGKAAIVSI
jgi:hypothetical protein